MTASAARWPRLAIFLTLNGLAVLAFGLLAVEPVFELLRTQRARIDAATVLLRQAAVAAERSRTLEALEPAAVEEAATRLIRGDSVSLLQADLLTRLRRIGEEQGVAFTRVLPLAPRKWHHRTLVGARIEFTGTTEQAAAILMTIEHGATLLFVQGAKFASADMGEGNSPQQVEAVIEVYGLAQEARA
jgi:hypothetical protein